MLIALPFKFLPKTSIAAFTLLLLCGLLFFWRLDAYSLFNITEAKQAEIARQMWVRHDWITPVYNGEIYFDKPVLLHWLMAIGYGIVGLNEWAVRLPSAIAATALTLATYAFADRFANRRTALIAATLLAANSFTFALGRTGQHDMLLVLFFTAALYCWYIGYSFSQTNAYLAFFALLALAVMSKGPLALVLGVLILGAFLVAVDRWREELRRLPWVRGGLIFAAIALPWHLLMLWRSGWQFIDQTFLYNNVSRFVSVNLNQSGPWWYYLPLVVVAMFPWIVLLPAAIAQAKRPLLQVSYWRRLPPPQQLSLFMTVWFVAVLLFMSVASTKLPWYVYPGLPALTYLCAQAWDGQMSAPSRWLQPSMAVIAATQTLLAIGLFVVPQFLPSHPVVEGLQEIGICWQWGIYFAAAAGATWVLALQKQAIGVWLVNVVLFGLLGLSITNQLVPMLDGVVLGGRLKPIIAVLRQETCDACSSDVTAAIGVVEPSLNFYSRLSRIPRFERQAELEAQLQQPQRLLLTTMDLSLQQADWNLGGYRPTVVSDMFKLFIIPPQSDDP